MDEKQKLKHLVKGGGVREALKYLNGLTTHRFSAIYRFDDKMLQNLVLFDRENPGMESMPDIPVLASYCVFVRDSARRFCVENSILDERVEGHPKRLEVIAYCGVPLMDRYGKMFGTICHFDVVPRPTQTRDIELMEEMSKLLERQQQASIFPPIE